jgi:hypothetical protein
MKNPELLQASFAVFLIGLAIAAAQTPPPVELKKECLCRSAPVKTIGFPTLRPLRPIRIIPPLKKMESK